MQLGMIGLGRMGANIVRRVMRKGHECVVYDRDPQVVKALAGEGATGVRSVAELASKLTPRRTVWVMVPAGQVTTSVIEELAQTLESGDTVIDGGNSYYRDDIRHAERLGERGIRLLDCGTSGGVWGLQRGYCLMIGGNPDAVAQAEPIFASVAPGVDTAPRTPGRNGEVAPSEKGYLHCGPTGAGHFVKMIHNGIEYGMMASLAEVAEVWRRGSVIGSWLLDLTAAALRESPELGDFAGRVSDSGEGRWTCIAAIDEGVPAPVLTTALYSRFLPATWMSSRTRRSRRCANSSVVTRRNPSGEAARGCAGGSTEMR
jgi:6-phosphogluconate dehydrogenase